MSEQWRRTWDMSKRLVGRTECAKVIVSTVLVPGIGTLKGAYESMVFVRGLDGRNTGMEVHQDRYLTLAEAQAGHNALVVLAESGVYNAEATAMRAKGRQLR